MKKIHIIYALLATLFFGSCEHDHLYFVNKHTATVGIRIDWKPAILNDLQLNGVTAVAFDSKSGDLLEVFPTYDGRDSVLYVPLPIGVWDIFFYNNTPPEYQYMTFDNVKHRSTFSADYVTTETKRTKSAQIVDDPIPIANPEIMASANVRKLEITKDMIDIHYNKPDYYIKETAKIFNIEAHRKIMTWVFTAEVEGLRYAAGAPYAHLIHDHAGYAFGGDHGKDSYVLQEFPWDKVVWDKNKHNGIIRKEVTSFHYTPYDEHHHLLDVDFKLLDGKSHILHEHFDNPHITDSIDPKDGVLKHWVHFKLKLPEAIGAGGSGFEPGSSEWDDIVIPL